MIFNWTESASLSGVVKHFKQTIKDKHLAEMATNCFLNTIQTTVRWDPGDLPYVLTGDISAMWLRDSSAQLEPYIRFAHEDPLLKSLIRGVVLRQAHYIVEDAYANAFNQKASGQHGFPGDRTDMGPWIYERKFEIDSLAHPIRLWWMYVHATGDVDVLRGAPCQAVTRMLEVLECEQDHEARSAYRFQRPGTNSSDTLLRCGLGPPSRPTGMIWSGFRPSDDATTYPYLIPAQMFMAVSLDMISEWADTIWADEDMQTRVQRLKSQILAGILRYGIREAEPYGRIWAYEVDGLGNALLMDDANVPSLLALPYLNFCAVDHPIYRNTRRWLLSAENPYYYEGKMLSGVGSPHTPTHYAWPLAVIMQAMTEPLPRTAWDVAMKLANADGGTGLMHESVDVDDPARYTRPWFAWANSMFAELILRALGFDPITRPPLVSRDWSQERVIH